MLIGPRGSAPDARAGDPEAPCYRSQGQRRRGSGRQDRLEPKVLGKNGLADAGGFRQPLLKIAYSFEAEIGTDDIVDVEAAEIG